MRESHRASDVRRIALSLAMGLVLCVTRLPARAGACGSTRLPEQPPRKSTTKDPPGMTRLMPGYDAWIDAKNKRVVVDGTVVLREGQLEMFACPRGTKEHESIVAVDTKAYAVHAGLLAVGAETGTPVQFQPKYEPATGTEVDVQVVWTDEAGKVQRDRAQDWIKNVKTGKADGLSLGLRRQRLLASRRRGQEALPGRERRLHLHLELPQRHARRAGREQPVERLAAVPGLSPSASRPLGTRVRLVLTPKAKK